LGGIGYIRAAVHHRPKGKARQSAETERDKKNGNGNGRARREKRLYSFSLQVSGVTVKRQKIARQARNFIEKGRILCYTEPKRQM